MKNNNSKSFKNCKVAVDLGNYNNKIIADDNIYSYESRFRLLDDDLSLDIGTIVEFDGCKYRHCDGEFEIQCVKASRENLLLNLYFSIAMSVKSNCNVDLAIGLPISQYKSDKDELINLIESNNKKTIKINNNEYTIKINDVNVVPEAIGAYYSLTDEIESLNVTIVDIGGKTTDICTISYEGSVQSYTTIQLGAFDTYTKILNAINEKYPTACVQIENVKHILNHGLKIGGTKVESNFIDYILDEDAKVIARHIKLNDKQNDLNYILLVGGHGNTLYKYLKQYINHIEIHDNYLYSNVIGYYNYLMDGDDNNE